MLNPDSFITSIIRMEALKYIAGYVAHKYRVKYPFLGTETRKLKPVDKDLDWIRFVSDGGLIYPSDEFMQVAIIMEKEFLAFHGEFGLRREKYIFKKLTKLVKSKINSTINVPDVVLTSLIRTRTYIRLRQMNKKLIVDRSEVKHKIKKKLKFVR